MDHKHQDHKSECRKDSGGGEETLEDRKRKVQPVEELAGKHYACMQLEQECYEEPLSAGTDSGYDKAAV